LKSRGPSSIEKRAKEKRKGGGESEGRTGVRRGMVDGEDNPMRDVEKVKKKTWKISG